MSSRTWLLVLIAITITVRLPTMFGVKRTGWDEHAYVFFAQTLDERGVAGIRQLLHDYPTNQTLQKSPLPTRLGFIIPAWLTCKVLGSFNADNLAWLSFLCGVGLVVVGARFAENLAGRKMSSLCAIFLITSPLAAALSRRGMQDSFAALFLLASLYFFDRCWRRQTMIELVALGLTLTVALLTKEAAVLLYPMMALASIYYLQAMGLRFPSKLILPLVAAPLVYLATQMWICQGLTNFIETYRSYASLQQTLEYTTHYEKGPWFRYLLDFFAIAPVVFVAAVIGFAAPAGDSTRHGRTLALIFLSSGILLFGFMPILNVRLILFLDLFLRLGVAMAICYFVAQFGEKWSRTVFATAVAVVLLSDVAQFYEVFVLGNVYSPTTFLILRAEGFYDVP